MNHLILTLLLSLPLGSFMPQPEAQPVRKGKDFALFFAVSNYTDPGWKDLRNPIKDCEAIAKELQEVYGFETKIHRDLSKRQILETILSWQKKTFKKDAQLLVFFSGHGTFSRGFSQGYFVPRDGKSDDPLNESHIELVTLGNAVTNINCPHILLAIDACYSGTIDREIAHKGGDLPGFISRPKPKIDFDPRQGTLDLQLRNKTRLLLTSGGKERTPDGVNHSPFAGAILKALRRAYTQGDGMVTFTDLLAVMERLQPTPHYGELVGHEEGGFVFLGPAVMNQPAPNVRKESERVASTSNTSTPGRTLEFPLPEMVFVRGGTFDMGQPDPNIGGSGRTDDEQPVHKVEVSDFYLGKYEVTVEQFAAFISATGYKTDAEKGGGSYFWTGSKWEKKAGVSWRDDASGNTRPRSDYTHPVIHVSWNDAVAYAEWVSGQTGQQWRLPTEAEWEYAAGGGSTNRTQYAGTNGESRFGDYAWYSSNSGSKTHPVGQKLTNGLELHDMSGNVWEWCSDWYSSNYYEECNKQEVIRNPEGPDSGSNRVLRGGGWNNYPQNCRVANRNYSSPTYRLYSRGFRLARSL